MREVEYTVIYEKGENHWGAYVPDLPGCTSTGRTIEEAQLHISEAIALWIEDAVECGEIVPLPTTLAGPSRVTVPSAA